MAADEPVITETVITETLMKCLFVGPIIDPDTGLQRLTPDGEPIDWESLLAAQAVGRFLWLADPSVRALVHDYEAAELDLLLYGTSIWKDGERIDPRDVG